jgi:phage shock protein A
MISIAFGSVIGLFVIGALVYAVSPSFRATVQVWFGKANANATTPLERQKNQYEQLVNAVNAQLSNVAGARAGAIQAEQDVTAAQADLAKLKGQYAQFKDSAKPETITELLNRIGKAQDHLKTSQTMAENAHAAAEMANKALDTAREQLADAADTIQSNEQKAQVTAVLNSAAKVSEDLKGVTAKLGSFNEANRQVDKDFLAAQERLKMGQGSTADQDLAALDKQSRADEVRKQLDAELAGGTPPAAK